MKGRLDIGSISLWAPLAAGLYWKKANGPGAMASILAGGLGWILLAGIQSAYPADLMATVLAAATLVIVTLATSRRRPALPLTDMMGKPVPYRDRLGVLGLAGRRAE